MMKCIIISLLLVFICYSQDTTGLRNPANRISFANALYCSKDYLRAALEYKDVYPLVKNDTVKYKMAVSYFNCGDTLTAYSIFSNFRNISKLYSFAQCNILKIYFQNNQYGLIKYYELDSSLLKTYVDSAHIKLNYLTNVVRENENSQLDLFTPSQQIQLNKIIAFKKDNPNKNKTTAGLLSILPGLGKFYLSEYGDGITAFIATTLLSYLSYDNFKHHHNFRGWLFGGLAGAFYGGSIYGSIAGVNLFNAKIYFDLNKKVQDFAESNDYFFTEIRICK